MLVTLKTFSFLNSLTSINVHKLHYMNEGFNARKRIWLDIDPYVHHRVDLFKNKHGKGEACA